MTASASRSRTYLHVFAAECAAAVREASIRASLEYERVAESVAVGQLELRRNQAEPQPEL